MVQLDATQLRELMLVVFRAERIVDSGSRKDGSHANCTSNELVLLTGNKTEDGGIESRHESPVKEVEKNSIGFYSDLKDR